MNISSYSIRKPIPAILIFALLCMAGAFLFKMTAVQKLPDVDMPVVTVIVAQPGAAPSQLENQVARKLEDTISTVTGIDKIMTTITDGKVMVTTQFLLEKNMTDAVSEVRDAVALIRSDLPVEIREPVITKQNTVGGTFAVYALQLAPNSSWTEQQLSWYADNAVNKKLLNIPGMGLIKRIGGVQREVQVILQPERMKALGVTAADISSISYNEQDAASGRSEVGGAEQTVRTISSAQNAQALAAMQIPLPNGTSVRLGDVAEVRDTAAEQRSVALVDGKPAIALEMYRTKGANEIEVAHNVEKAVAELRGQNPNVKIERVVNNIVQVQNNFDGSMSMLYEGAFLAVVVVYFFLREWRSTLVAASALPLSIIPTFIGIYLFGYSLNTVTLMSLTLVVGVLVDDAIVEIENIERHLRMGKSPYEAAMEAADEIGLAVLATTFALVSVFFPMAFMGGIVGLFFKQFAWTAVISILFSLLVARLVTPMMAAYLMAPHKGEIVPAEEDPAAPPDLSRDGKFMRRYMRIMQWCLHHRFITLLAAFVMFAASISLAPLLPKGFAPAGDHDQTQVTLQLPPGSTLAQTQHLAETVRKLVVADKNIVRVLSSIGGGSSASGPSGSGAEAEINTAVLTVVTTPRKERKESVIQIENRIRKTLADIPGARITVGSADMGNKMDIALMSDDSFMLNAAGREAERQLRTLSGIGGVKSSAALVRPELIIRPDYDRASSLGITAAAIARTVRVATSGDYDQFLAKMNLPDRQVPIRVKLPDSYRGSVDNIRQLLVPARGGIGVPLETVAQVSLESGPSQIDRINRNRSFKITVELAGKQLGEVNDAAKKLPIFKQLPQGVYISEQGDAQEMGKLFRSFGLAMAIGVICIYSVLVLLFDDFMQPLTILMALPLSIGGAFVALLVTGKALSMPSLLGMITLMGLVTKNSILLVDYAIVAQAQGKSRSDALIDACHKRSRPILMTSIAMAAGMVPLALGLSKGDPSFNSPMAIAVIGGLVTSTVLSLLVVPATYTYIDDFEHWLQRTLKSAGKRKKKQA